VERVQARLKRLMLISGLTVGLGILAVFAAIVYRIVAVETRAPATAWQAGAAAARLSLSEMGLPADAQLISADVDGDRLLLTFVHDGGNTLVIIDAETFAVIASMEVKGR